MADSSVRARTVPEIVDAAFRVFRRHFGAFTLLAAIAGLPWWITLVASGGAGVIYDQTQLLQVMTAASFSGVSIWLLAFFAPLTVCWFIVADAAIVIAASDAFLGRDVVPARALRAALRVGWRVIGARIIKGLAISVGFLFFIIPGFWLIARYFAVVPAVVLEDAGAIDSFHRSRDLSNGAKGRILGALVLTFLLYYCLEIAVQAITNLIPAVPALRVFVPALVQVTVYPIIGIVTALLYYDMRIRKEAYDLELLAANIAPANAGA